jgi:hypothetical protein
MGSHRVQLPHETDRVFLTDGGTETWLIHKRGLELPHFSSFHLLNDHAATDAIRAYYRAFADIAVEHGTGYIFDSLTYRASRDWGDRLGYSAEALADMNHRCLALYRDVAAEAGMHPQDVVISGCIGPQADAYGLDDALTADAAEAYHRVQVETFKSAGADLVTALSLSSSQEAIGIVRASGSVDLPSSTACGHRRVGWCVWGGLVARDRLAQAKWHSHTACGHVVDWRGVCATMLVQCSCVPSPPTASSTCSSCTTSGSRGQQDAGAVRLRPQGPTGHRGARALGAEHLAVLGCRPGASHPRRARPGGTVRVPGRQDVRWRVRARRRVGTPGDRRTLRKSLGGRGFGTPIERLLFALVAQRALDPGSKLAAERWVGSRPSSRVPEVEVQQLYRAMDFLLEAHDEIQREVFWSVRNLFNLEVDVLFIDTTSTYFEIEGEDDGWCSRTTRTRRAGAATRPTMRRPSAPGGACASARGTARTRGLISRRR